MVEPVNGRLGGGQRKAVFQKPGNHRRCGGIMNRGGRVHKNARRLANDQDCVVFI
jgi:hypothetical protein